MFLQGSTNKISTMKRFCLCYLLVLSTQVNTTRSKSSYQRPICNKDTFNPIQCLGDRRRSSGGTCLWIPYVLKIERKVCEELEKGTFAAVIRNKADFLTIKELIESTHHKIDKTWIDVTYDGKRKKWFHGLTPKNSNEIHKEDPRIREITKAAYWGMTEDFEKIEDIRCLAAVSTFTGLWTKQFKYRVKYTLRDCSERLPFYCYRRERRKNSVEFRVDMRNYYYSGKQAKAHKEAVKFCIKLKRTMQELWKSIRHMATVFLDHFEIPLLTFHVGLNFGNKGRQSLYWHRPPTKNGAKEYDRKFGIHEYEKVDGNHGNCAVLYHSGRFRSYKCSWSSSYNFNSVCESDFALLENVRQKVKVHYHRRNKKFFVDEILKIECSGDTIHVNNSITWKVLNLDGTKYRFGSNAKPTPTAIVYKENRDGFCLKEMVSSFEIKVEDYWFDKKVVCYIPKRTGYDKGYDHCDKQYCKGVTIDIVDTPLQKPEFVVSYPGYPGKLYEGMIVTITCVAEYSFQRFTEIEINSMVVFGSINESTVVITNKLQNTSTFDIRTFHENIHYLEKWYEKLFTRTHRLYVEVKFNMTAELTGLTFDCFGLDVEYHELPKVCKLGDPYCTRSERFGISVRPSPPPYKSAERPNFLVYFIVFTILSTLLFTILCIWCRRTKKQLPDDDPLDAVEKRRMSHADIVDVDEPTERSYEDRYGDGAAYNSVVDQKSDAYSSLGVNSTKDGGSSILGARQTSIATSHTTKTSEV